MVDGAGEVIGVSNNVNYDVQGDGSTAFNLVKTDAYEAAALTLEQESGLNPVNEDHTVTATVTDDGGEPVEGAVVEFEVTGANGPQSAAAVTDANGQAEFAYTGTVEGDDTITATVFDTDLQESLLKVWTTNTFQASTSGAEDVTEHDDWWQVEIQDENGNQLLPLESDRILYERPDGTTMDLDHAGTSYLWWERNANYAEGVHTLYYLYGDTWYVLTSEFDENSVLIAVNGDPYP